MANAASGPQAFAATPSIDARRRFVVPLPFDPDEVWGTKPQHHVTGTIDGHAFRGPLVVEDGRVIIRLGPSWHRDCPVEAGKRVKVVVSAEGPQREGLASDVAAALDASPAAGAFFDSLATFYRKAYLRWIDATTRRPDVRAERIAEVIGLLEAGVKERPR